LIEFSNQHFYKNRLILLPDRLELNEQSRSITYVKTEGMWEHQTNRAEALEVVSLIQKLSQQNPRQSIGVVTFNAPQQELIRDCLEERATSDRWPIPDSLFIKNIENVQGDERDVIIFSTGYAPDKKGKLHLQFGSLSMDGGENRLNVAITRAREKIFIVTSIYPDQLAVENTLHAGPKLLKKYLQFAWGLQVSGNSFAKSPITTQRGIHLKYGVQQQMLHRETGVWKVNALPFADLHTERLGQFEAVVLTDDEQYHACLSAKQHHAYKPIALTQRQWPFKSVFSRQYWSNRERLITELQRM